MKISDTTMNLLTELDCPDANKVIDNMIEAAYEHFVTNPKPNEKLYFGYRAVNGKIFLETETRIVTNNSNKK